MLAEVIRIILWSNATVGERLFFQSHTPFSPISRHIHPNQNLPQWSHKQQATTHGKWNKPNNDLKRIRKQGVGESGWPTVRLWSLDLSFVTTSDDHPLLPLSELQIELLLGSGTPWSLYQMIQMPNCLKSTDEGFIAPHPIRPESRLLNLRSLH